MGLVPCLYDLPIGPRQEKMRHTVSQKSETIKVGIVEDTGETREALALLIRGSSGFDCVAACESAEEALKLFPQTQPDVALMDIQLPGMSGIDCIRHLKLLLPELQIMMLTVFEDHERIFKSLAAGATGYIIKKTKPAKLLESIRELRLGGAPMSSQIARQVVEHFQGPAPDRSSASMLSPREREVLDQLALGFLYKEIADKLGIAIGTVRVHIRRIYEKLHVRNRTEAVLKIYPKPSAAPVTDPAVPH